MHDSLEVKQVTKRLALLATSIAQQYTFTEIEKSKAQFRARRRLLWLLKQDKYIHDQVTRDSKQETVQ